MQDITFLSRAVSIASAADLSSMLFWSFICLPYLSLALSLQLQIYLLQKKNDTVGYWVNTGVRQFFENCKEPPVLKNGNATTIGSISLKKNTESKNRWFQSFKNLNE
jgi:hypothetical protein